MLRRIAFAGAVFGLNATVIAPALGATATASLEILPGPIRITVLEYRAEPGEANSLDVIYEDRRIRFRDVGAAIRPGPGCIAVTPNEVTCAGNSFSFEVYVEAGDENDVVTGGRCPLNARMSCDFFRVDGGDGDDAVAGSGESDVLVGGQGDDHLNGRDGQSDRLDGGPGADTLIGGRGGWDRVAYADRTSPVLADLDGLPDDGEAGEGDRIARDIEELWGGSANDRLTGDARRNMLVGGPGADVLRTGDSPHDFAWHDLVWADEFRCEGRAGGADLVVGGPGFVSVHGCGGDDRIYLGPGHDYVEGGPGDDFISARAGRDSLWGNAGADVIFGGTAGEFMVNGGPGDDVLLAGAGDDDPVIGSYGDDVVWGGGGRDRLFGDGEFGEGGGRDTLYACDAERDHVNGGRGTDRGHVDRVDRVRSVESLPCQGLAG